LTVKTDIASWVREQWDRCAAWICVAAGVVMLIVGWIGVSGTPYTADQIPYLASNGLGGLFLLGLGAMLWLSADLRDEWRKLDRIESKLDRIEGAVREHGTSALVELRPAGGHRSAAPTSAAASSPAGSSASLAASR
jgi:hypothetical protein